MKKILTITSVLAMCISGAAFANDNMDEHFKMMDTNGDGMISKEEHAAAAEKMFEKADTNGDGMLSKDEMAAKKEEWKKKHNKVKANTGITRDKGVVDDEKSK